MRCSGPLAVLALVLGASAVLPVASGCRSDSGAEGGPNAPCTRSRDCQQDLSCDDGVCTELDGGVTSGEGGADETEDAGDDG